MIAAVLVIAIALTGGSDSPTPYTVDQVGITLPAGTTFPDNGHVNVRTDAGTFNLHAESKCVTRTDAECAGARHDAAQFIGQSFIPWSAFGITSGCVSWVQLSDFNEHYGEGGQSPVCLGQPPVDPPVDPPAEACVVALWKAESVSELWPQALVTSRPNDCATIPEFETVCGAQYQADIYADDAVTAALLAGGVLRGPSDPAESWPGGAGYQPQLSRVWVTDACPPVVDPPVVVKPPVVVTPTEVVTVVEPEPLLASTGTSPLGLLLAGGVMSVLGASLVLRRKARA